MKKKIKNLLFAILVFLISYLLANTLILKSKNKYYLNLLKTISEHMKDNEEFKQYALDAVQDDLNSTLFF